MPRKNKNTSKHPRYQKPDYHSQNKSSQNNNNNNSSMSNKQSSKKNKLRTSYDIYKRLQHDPNLGVDLNNVYIGYEDTENTSEIPFNQWVMIEDGGDIPMHRIQYFVLYINNERIVIWDKFTKLDRLFCSGSTNKTTQSLKSILSNLSSQPQHIHDEKQKEEHIQININMPSRPIINHPAIAMIDSLLNTFTEEQKYNDDSRQIGFIFMGGSYNPVHSQHIELMVVIKKYFEDNHNIDIKGGHLVITTDGYVAAKLKEEAISFEHRKRLCELICDKPELQWIHPSKYQCGSAIQYLQNEYITRYPNALMINCMGADKILKSTNTGKWRKYAKNYNKRKCLTVCIKRRGYAEEAYDLYLKDVKNGVMKKKDEKAFMFIDVEVEQVSSTMIRQILTDYKAKVDTDSDDTDYDAYKDKLGQFVGGECAEYLLENIKVIWYKKVGGKKKKQNRKIRAKIAPWDD